MRRFYRGQKLSAIHSYPQGMGQRSDTRPGAPVQDLEPGLEDPRRQPDAADAARVIGGSTVWTEVLRQVGRVATSDTSVIITGESGTGKEVIARLVHQR